MMIFSVITQCMTPSINKSVCEKKNKTKSSSLPFIVVIHSFSNRIIEYSMVVWNLKFSKFQISKIQHAGYNYRLFDFCFDSKQNNWNWFLIKKIRKIHWWWLWLFVKKWMVWWCMDDVKMKWNSMDVYTWKKLVVCNEWLSIFYQFFLIFIFFIDEFFIF